MPVRIPPHDDDAEQAILGALLIDKEAVTRVSESLSPEYFYNDTNKFIYECMLELYEARRPLDTLTISNVLKKKKLLSKVGGRAYLTSLADAVPTAAHVEHYAQIVKEKFIRRFLIKSGASMTEYAFSEDQEMSEILDRVEHTIFQISQKQASSGFIHVKSTLAESFDRLDELHKSGNTHRGVETGFFDLDSILSGFHPSNLVILAARPGVGKTAFVVNISQHITVQLKKPVGIFSLEMSKEELVDRLLISQADIDAWKLKTGRLSEDDFERLSQAMGELADAPLFIDDTPGITISDIRTKARRLHMEHNLSLIVVDYLQLANPGKKLESRVQEVSYVSQNLKNLARELRVPVLALSQLSRAVEHRGGSKRPQLADLRESGAIEQDADVVMFLYSDDEGIASQRLVNVLIAKHRNGPTGERQLLFRGDRIRFYNIDQQSREGEGEGGAAETDESGPVVN